MATPPPQPAVVSSLQHGQRLRRLFTKRILLSEDLKTSDVETESSRVRVQYNKLLSILAFSSRTRCTRGPYCHDPRSIFPSTAFVLGLQEVVRDL